MDHSLFRMHITSHNHIGTFGCAAFSSWFLLSIWYCLRHSMCTEGSMQKYERSLALVGFRLTATVVLATPSYKSNRLGIYKKKFQVVAPHFRIRKYIGSQIAPNYLSPCTSCTSQYLQHLPNQTDGNTVKTGGW